MAPIGTSNFDLPFVPLITCPILTIPSLQVKKDKTDNKLIVKFRLESVGDDLRAGEGAARCAVFLPFARPVGLSNYKAKLLDSCLSLPLLNICPPHPFLAMLDWLVVELSQVKPVLNRLVFCQLGSQFVGSSIQSSLKYTES